MEDVINYLVVALILIYPTWRIYDRVGLNPALSLFIFIPFLGPLVVGYILALSSWPKIEQK